MSEREARFEQDCSMSVVPKRCARILLLATVVMGMIGCATQRAPVPIEESVAATQQQAPVDHGRVMGDRIADTALSMVGTPYLFGGSTPHGFDCSGLVYFAYGQNGMKVPRTSREQRRRAKPVNRRSLKRGDLLFFDTGWKSGHVGIYIGDSQFVHSPSSGQRVSVVRLDVGYFASRLEQAARLHD